MCLYRKRLESLFENETPSSEHMWRGNMHRIKGQAKEFLFCERGKLSIAFWGNNAKIRNEFFEYQNSRLNLEN